MTETGSSPSFDYEVTILVLTYHSDWNALRRTLLSSLLQQNIRMEIVIADDGSENPLHTEIESLFRLHGFRDYQLITHEANHGTIANYISGLLTARGEYTKSIAPGDFLSDNTILRRWVDYLRNSGYNWSFSDIQYYEMNNQQIIPLSTPPFPVYLSPYLKQNNKKARWNYAVLDDAAHGVSMLGKTSLKLKYAEELALTGNKYCEDYLFRIMMFDGVCAAYYPELTVFYEFGTGVSSGKSAIWRKRIYDEFFQLCRMLTAREASDPFQRKMQNVIRRKTSKAALMLVPGKLLRTLLFMIIRRKPRKDFAESAVWRQQCR